MTPRHKVPLFLILLSLLPLPLPASSPTIERDPNGVVLKLKDGFLRLRFVTDSIARVSFATDRTFFAKPSLAVLDRETPPPKWDLKEKPRHLEIWTSKLMLSVDLPQGTVEFIGPDGEVLLSEAPGGRILEPAMVQDAKTFHVRQRWEPNRDESLYGLGQHQYGVLDWKGYDLDLWQRNTTAAVPFLASSRGYGILWDNPSYTRFGDLRPFVPIPSANLLDRDGNPGGLTLTKSRSHSAGSKGEAEPEPETAPILKADLKGLKWDEKPHELTWEGFLVPPVTGDFQFDAYSNGGIKAWIDGKKVMDHWRQGWLSDHDRAMVPLKERRKVPLRIEWDTEQGSTLELLWKTPNPSKETSLWSEVGEGVDYYFVYGPSLDAVTAGYRELTGQAPLMPSWAFGFWQSRQRYHNEKEGLEAAKGFRKRRIPIDNLVQDWQYWKPDAWGSHEFDPERFPDPAKWLKRLHDLKFHVMISVWPKYYPGSGTFQEMREKGFLYGSILDRKIDDWLKYPYTFYDAFNPAARALFWEQLDRKLFQKGIDAWWMDATEPDLMPSPPTLSALKELMNPTALGPGTRVLNAYPLMNSEGIYQGQRRSAPDQRVFILTRCAYTGLQRAAAAVWSGDVTSTWASLAKQIPAGLGLSLSGIPYWTTDIGGYTMPWRFNADGKPSPEDEEEWRELNVRWFQFAAFCPLFRSHGEQRPREMWEFGGEKSPAYQAMLKFDRLRYRLFPYLYSTAWDVTKNGATFMRPMVMDFPQDKPARGLESQYLFGRSFLVAPVTEHQKRAKAVYLPEGTAWYDFWTGEAPLRSGWHHAEAPCDSLPLFVRAGSIVPFGPELQYVSEKKQDPITLFIYAGADGDFTLYEDDGVTYGYEKGEFTEIPIRWDDKDMKLTIGERRGSYKGMLEKRNFEVVLVTKDNPVGFSFKPKPLTRIRYEGKASESTLKK